MSSKHASGTRWGVTARMILILPGAVMLLAAVLGIAAAFRLGHTVTGTMDLVLDGAASVVDAGHATIEQIGAIVSQEKLPGIAGALSLTGSEASTPGDAGEMVAVPLSHLQTGLIAELRRLNLAAEAVTNIIVSANHTLELANTFPLIEIPPLPLEKWQAVQQRLSGMLDAAGRLATMLAQSRSGLSDVLREEIQAQAAVVQDMSLDLRLAAEKIQAELRQIQDRMVAIKATAANLVFRVCAGIGVALLWITASQAYLLFRWWVGRNQ